MARTAKIGLDYFPMDVDLFQDIKIRKLIKYQGGKAFTVYALLLCLIYKSGYYMLWDSELPFIISEQTGFEEAYISEVIKNCVALGLLSKKMFEKGILTSKGIQARYVEICKQSKRKVVISNFSLISSEEIGISSEEIGISSEEIPINSGLMQQSKVKESKEKKKETPLTGSKEKPAPAAFSSPWVSDDPGSSSAAGAAGVKTDPPDPPDPGGEETPPPGSAPPPSPKRRMFVRPAVDEVRAYCAERGNGIDAQMWYDYYESNGWMVGRNHMKDWKAAVRTWEKRDNTLTISYGRENSKRFGATAPDDFAGKGSTQL